MFQVKSLMKTGFPTDLKSQQYTLVLNDLENTRKGYVGSTKSGTEEALRTLLRNRGMPATEIDAAFERVKA